MLTFKEWCHIRLGIIEINEGKIVRNKFLPIEGNSFLMHPRFVSLIAKYATGFIQRMGRPGYVFSSSAYNDVYKLLVAHNVKFISEDYKTPAPFYIQVEESKHSEFCLQLSAYLPFESVNPLNNMRSFCVLPQALDALYAQYFAEKLPTESKEFLNKQLRAFNSIENSLKKSDIPHLEKAHLLSLDYDNSNFSSGEASTAYGFSLHIFAEAYKSSLSLQDYCSLKHVMRLLMLDDDKGNIIQGLQTDISFTDYLIYKLDSQRLNQYQRDGSRFLIAQSPKYEIIMNAIRRNAYGLIYGQNQACLQNGQIFKMRRFVPDALQQSETNEIILQTGGMIDHSAITRIIKVGMLKNGTKAAPGELPHYFDYFKIHTNLGAGKLEPEWVHKTCTGTFVTKLQPTAINEHSKIQVCSTSPISDPVRYQQQMEHTLQELIKAERQICFYRCPQKGFNGEEYSLEQSAEANEWRRLNNRIRRLSGKFVRNPVVFDVVSSSGQLIPWSVHNQKGYFQEGGSCPVFSIKQFVTSIIGHRLASLHSHFLQSHNSYQHLDVMRYQILWTQQRLHYLELVAHEALNNYLNYLKEVKNNPRCDVDNYFLADLDDILRDYPEFYQQALDATNDWAEAYRRFYKQILDARESNELFAHFAATYLQLPKQFKDYVADTYKKVSHYHQLCMLFNEALNSSQLVQLSFARIWDIVKTKAPLVKEVLMDLNTLTRFYCEKQQLFHAMPEYICSLQEFYQRALEIRLSNTPIKQQVVATKRIADRLFAKQPLMTDVRLLIDSQLFAGLGASIGWIRNSEGPLFWRSDLPTMKERTANKALSNSLVM